MKNNSKIKQFDVVIIGAGPAGLTCAIYAARANLKVCFIDKGAPGGKMTKTFNIENWSGDEQVKGYELSLRMLNHAKKAGAQHIFGNVVNIESKSNFKQNIYLEDGSIIESKSLVIATGMISKVPEIKNIDDFENKGLSYCVICDATLYKGLPAAIIGGGDSAFEEALYLASVASKVTIFVRSNKARAEQKIIDEVKKHKNIEIFYNARIIELIGKDSLEKIKYIKDDKESEMVINHLYPYIGQIPSNNFAKELPIFDENGFILTDDNLETSIPGIYAIGDIRKKQIRQIITAASDGAIVGKILATKIGS